MKKIFVLVIAIMIGINFSFAENDKTAESSAPTTSLSGKVIDNLTGETLAGVMVKLSGTDHYVFSDFDGNFRFDDLKPLKYEITLSLISYEKAETEVDLHNGTAKPLNVKLKNIK
ncbi:MAG: carboxypeptidase-like regulatory domain-containing protein [Bacteroidales bacterium]|nr:carboxypeptidase-like regulatory domain-containing protein [Bacteroidales bacterium]